MNKGTQLTKSGALAHLTTLTLVVEDYKMRFDFSNAGKNNSVGHDDPVVDFCKETTSLPVAIDRACAGRRRDGKLFKKGSCVRTLSKKDLAEKLKAKLSAIRGAKTFEDVYDIVNSVSPWGIGAMSKYAIAERIAAYLDIKPEAYLYLHAGPLEGWKRLMRYKPVGGRVAVSVLPKPFRKIELYHVENLLCEYRDLLHPGMLNEQETKNAADVVPRLRKEARRGHQPV
jgi:hypothetical protein